MLSAFFLDYVTLTELAAVLTAGTLVSVLSTLAFAVVESWRGGADADADAA
jgi:putative membrane protein